MQWFSLISNSFLLIIVLLAGCGSPRPQSLVHPDHIDQLESSALLSKRSPMAQLFSWELINDDPYGQYTIYFDYDDDAVRPHQRDNVKKVVAYAHEIIGRGETVICEGHAGLYGKKQWYQERIAKRRAQSVARELVKHGIAKKSIKLFSRGQAMPAFPDRQYKEGDSATNRRVEVYGIAD
ncbi:MAG: OmpA family protein [Candidatus Babeliales bacterium]